MQERTCGEGGWADDGPHQGNAAPANKFTRAQADGPDTDLRCQYDVVPGVCGSEGGVFGARGNRLVADLAVWGEGSDPGRHLVDLGNPRQQRERRGCWPVGRVEAQRVKELPILEYASPPVGPALIRRPTHLKHLNPLAHRLEELFRLHNFEVSTRVRAKTESREGVSVHACKRAVVVRTHILRSRYHTSIPITKSHTPIPLPARVPVPWRAESVDLTFCCGFGCARVVTLLPGGR